MVALGWMATAHATVIDVPLPNVAQEAHARVLFHELKCVVCEGQSLADSNAMLAVEMRAHIRRMLADGKTDAVILEFFRARYGERILMTPPLKRSTVLLWFAPLLLLCVGGFLLWRATRQPAKESS